MSMDNYQGNTVARRKAEVRRRSRTLQISGGVAVAGVVLGVVTTNFFYLVAVVALVVFVANAWKIREVVNQKDQW
ncbi:MULTISPECIES: hypothetical protein [Corynebacterium]|jgi:hypothetical protein|nr:MULTISPECIES: hypothetical protein [Corynebacterium]MCI1256512.1 hypothetical protein [Corynebacterium provencense]